MYKKFYFYKTMIDILMAVPLLLFAYLEKNIVSLLILFFLIVCILFIFEKYKFPEEQKKTRNFYEKSSSLIVVLLLWLGRDFNKVFILVALVLLIAIELEEYKKVKKSDY